MRKHGTIAIALLLTLAFGASACTAAPAATEPTPAAAEPAATPEAVPAETPEASADPAVTPDPNKKALLVVSFGTSYNESRALTIEAIEKVIADAYPDYEMRRAFTSQTIIDKLKDRDGLEIDNVEQALERLIADGIGTLAVQPTHVMSGFEYDEMIAAIKPYESKFTSVSYGLPLLTSDADYQEVVSILQEEIAPYNVEGTAIVFMGHGTHHEANATYAKLQQAVSGSGMDNCLIGTVEAEPSLEDVMAAVEQSGAKKVVLLPFMIVAGDHANNDMAGDEEGSWKTAFKGEGYEVECVIKGLGEYKGIQKMFVEHAGDAIGQ